MIIERIIGFVFTIFTSLLARVGFLGVTIPADGVNVFLGFIKIAGYFVPLGTIVLLLGALLAMELFKIVVSFFKLLLSFIPFF